MDGYTTPWMDDEDDDDDFDHNKEEDAVQHENEGGEEGEEQDVAHDDNSDEQGREEEEHADDEDRSSNTPLTAAVHDPHLEEILIGNASTDPRFAGRRKSKLDQLEIDSRTPLYDAGRGPEETRLRVTLDIQR